MTLAPSVGYPGVGVPWRSGHLQNLIGPLEKNHGQE
jgi:hypothetical protein